MKKKFFSILLTTLIVCSAALAANAASYFYDDGSNEDNPNVDKFKPQSGVKIKESGLARMMENATQNAMDSSKGKKNTTQSTVQTQQKEQGDTTNSYKRSYKWF